jgi:hypothetical protein
LRIVDLRSEGRASSGMLRGIEREVYLHCCDIRSQTQLMARFPTVPQKDLDEMLKCFVAEDLMFEEKGRFLSLAMAKDARAAAARIASQAVHVAKRRALPTLEVSRN